MKPAVDQSHRRPLAATRQPAKVTLLHMDVSRGISVGHECCERRMRRSSLLTAATKLLSEESAAGDFFPMY
jgi:hypothetical protein